MCVSSFVFKACLPLHLSLSHSLHPSLSSSPPSASLHSALPFPFLGTWLEHYSKEERKDAADQRDGV